MKKIRDCAVCSAVASILLLIALLSVNIYSVDMKYVDVPETKWYYNFVKGVSETYIDGKALMSGMSSLKFSPESCLTRADAVKILYMLKGVNTENEHISDAAFSDVTTENKYFKYISWAVEEGIVNGYPDGTFKPSNLLTRMEAAVLTDRLILKIQTDYEFCEEADTYSDYDAIPVWALSSIQRLNAIGVMVGDDKNCFNPKKNITRAEFAAIVFNTYNFIYEK